MEPNRGLYIKDYFEIQDNPNEDVIFCNNKIVVQETLTTQHKESRYRANDSSYSREYAIADIYIKMDKYCDQNGLDWMANIPRRNLELFLLRFLY